MAKNLFVNSKHINNQQKKMAKFKVHKYNQAYMARIGIHSYNLNDPTNEFFKSFITFCDLFIAVMLFVTSSALFVYINFPNLEIILQPFSIIMGGLEYGGMYFNIGMNMKKVKLLHLTLQQIVNEAERDTELKIYWNAEKKCRKYTKAMACFIIVDQTMLYGALFSSIYNIFIGNLDTSTWMLPFGLVVPFNTKTILGWYIFWLIQDCMGLSYSTSMSAITSYFVGSCFYVGAICDHVDLLLDSLKGDIQSNNEEKNATNLAKKKYKQIQKLQNLVELHVKLYDVFKMVGDINSGSIFSLLLPNVLFVACTMYNIEHFGTQTRVLIAWDVIGVICALVWPFLFAYFATFATYRVAAIAQAAYNSNWLDLPPTLQKYIILIIIRSQEPIYFTGFGLFRCTLDVLGQLLKTSCSYYLIFRRFKQPQQL